MQEYLLVKLESTKSMVQNDGVPNEYKQFMELIKTFYFVKYF